MPPGPSTGDSTRSRRGRAGVRGEPLPFLALLQHGQVLRGRSHGRKGGRKCSETAIFCCSLPLYGQRCCLRRARSDLGTRCRADGREAEGPPPLQPGPAEHGHVSGILLPSIPQNLEPK